MATPDKPNILVISGDDIGIWKSSFCNRGAMGCRTPSIDGIAAEGMLFTDAHGEQICAAGRSSLITGPSVFRTVLSKVGAPDMDVGGQAEDPTIADRLRARGYATGPCGRYHLGDLNEYPPTVRGFDVFFGNFYHLNAEEDSDPERLPEFNAACAPRCRSSEHDDPTEQPRGTSSAGSRWWRWYAPSRATSSIAKWSRRRNSARRAGPAVVRPPRRPANDWRTP